MEAKKLWPVIINKQRMYELDLRNLGPRKGRPPGRPNDNVAILLDLWTLKRKSRFFKLDTEVGLLTPRLSSLLILAIRAVPQPSTATADQPARLTKTWVQNPPSSPKPPLGGEGRCNSALAIAFPNFQQTPWVDYGYGFLGFVLKKLFFVLKKL